MAVNAAARSAPAFRPPPTPRRSRLRKPTVRGDAPRSRPVPRATAVSSEPSSPTEPFTLGLRRDAEDALVLGEPIGRGAMGVVRSCTRRSDGCRFALKTIPKAGPRSLEGATPTGEAMSVWERKVRDEVNLHFALGASLDIVTLHDAFEDEAGVHLLIDLCDGGDLLTGASSDADAKKDRWKPFTEAAAATTIRATLRALAACHAHGVVHRDVKPANFLYMVEPDGSRRAKLSDFGLAARIKKTNGALTERCGTYAYLSPEMARRRPYDFKVDAWAAGVVAYMLLAGEPPFADWDAIRDGREPTREGLLRAIRRGRPVVPIDRLSLSPGAKSLLSSLLEPNPERRMSCAAAAEHYWVRERGAASHADPLARAVVEKLQAYGTLGAARRACLRAAFEEAERRETEQRTRFTDEDENARFSSVDDELAGSDLIKSARDAKDALVAAVDEAAERACAERAEACEVSSWGDDADDGKEKEKAGVSAAALERALRDHGAELAPEEWLSLIRPFASGKGKDKKSSGSFLRNAALAAALAAPLGGSFAETERAAAEKAEENDERSSADRSSADAIRSPLASSAMAAEETHQAELSYDWTAVAAASFRRLVAKDRVSRQTPRDADGGAVASASVATNGGGVAEGASVASVSTATVAFDDVADEVCAWDESEELCRATLRAEFVAADADGDGRLGIAEWTDLVWAEGLMDGSGRVKSSCGADAPAHDPAGPRNAGVGQPGCELAPEASVRRPPAETELSPREKARAAAEARRKMAAARAEKRNARNAARRDPPAR